MSAPPLPLLPQASPVTTAADGGHTHIHEPTVPHSSPGIATPTAPPLHRVLTHTHTHTHTHIIYTTIFTNSKRLEHFILKIKHIFVIQYYHLILIYSYR